MQVRNISHYPVGCGRISTRLCGLGNGFGTRHIAESTIRIWTQRRSRRSQSVGTPPHDLQATGHARIPLRLHRRHQRIRKWDQLDRRWTQTLMIVKGVVEGVGTHPVMAHVLQHMWLDAVPQPYLRESMEFCSAALAGSHVGPLMLVRHLSLNYLSRYTTPSRVLSRE